MLCPGHEQESTGHCHEAHTLQEHNQLMYPQTWVFAMVLVICTLIPMNYLNKVLSWMIFGWVLGD
jgi:hypothetical protein